MTDEICPICKKPMGSERATLGPLKINDAISHTSEQFIPRTEAMCASHVDAPDDWPSLNQFTQNHIRTHELRRNEITLTSGLWHVLRTKGES